MPDTRVLGGPGNATGANLEIEVYADGVLTNSSTPVTVTVTRASGTVLAIGASTTNPSTGIYRYVLTPQVELDRLTLVWSVTIGGVAQTLTTSAEIVGAHLFTLADLRGLRVGSSAPFASTADYPNNRLLKARDATTDEFTRILGFSPVPRYRRVVLHGDGSSALLLPDSKVHRIISVTINGVAQTPSGYIPTDTGMLESTTSYGWGAGFAYGRSNVIVEYAHGWQEALGDATNVAMLRAAMRLQPSMSSTVTTVSTPDGSSYSFDAAGQVTGSGRVREFGVPAIDAWLNRWMPPGSVA